MKNFPVIVMVSKILKIFYMLKINISLEINLVIIMYYFYIDGIVTKMKYIAFFLKLVC